MGEEPIHAWWQCALCSVQQKDHFWPVEEPLPAHSITKFNTMFSHAYNNKESEKKNKHENENNKTINEMGFIYIYIYLIMVFTF